MNYKYKENLLCTFCALRRSSVAVDVLRKQFADSGVTLSETKGGAGEGSTVYEGERVRLIVASWEAYTAYAASAEAATYDTIFDKDAYAFLGPAKGAPYAADVVQLLRPGGFVYLEVKNRADGGAGGPPFHVSTDDIAGSFGAAGARVVKDFGTQPAQYGPAMKQVAYMLRKGE